METATQPESRAIPCNTVEQGQAARPATSTEAEGDLGHSDSTATGSSNPRTRAIQPRHRQQVARAGCREVMWRQGLMEPQVQDPTLFYARMVIAPTPAITQTRPIKVAGARFSPRNTTLMATPIGTRR
jgi:hypothetical protein